MSDNPASSVAQPPFRGVFGSPAFHEFAFVSEWVLGIALFVILTCMLISIKLVHVDQMQGDSAAFFQATENIATRGKGVSQVQAAIVDYYRENKMVTTPVAQIAADPQAFGRTTPVAERSLMVGHAYYILYLIAPLAHVFPVNAVLLTFYVMTFVGLVFGAYFVLRARAVGPLAAALFGVLIVSHASWSESLLWGQFYPDRLFILTGFILMCVASWKFEPRQQMWGRFILALAAILCALVNERGALTAGLFLVAYAVLYWTSLGNERYVKIGLGVGLLAYGYGIMKFVIPTNSDYGTFLPTNFAGVMYIVHTAFFANTVGLFFLVNLPMLLLASFQWRAAIIALLLMMPNVFGNIGGAEKLGWSTHYHSFYLPVLIWAAMLGYATIYARARQAGRSLVVYLGTAALILLSSMIDPYSFKTFSVKPANMTSSFIPRFIYQAQTFIGPTGDQFLAQADELRRLVPEHNEVSTVQMGMPSLYHNRVLQHFPNDLDHSQYAVLGGQLSAGVVTYNGAISYVGGDATDELQKLALERMKHDGYDLEHPSMLPLLGLAVVKRNR